MCKNITDTKQNPKTLVDLLAGCTASPLTSWLTVSPRQGRGQGRPGSHRAARDGRRRPQQARGGRRQDQRADRGKVGTRHSRRGKGNRFILPVTYFTYGRRKRKLNKNYQFS